MERHLDPVKQKVEPCGSAEKSTFFNDNASSYTAKIGADALPNIVANPLSMPINICNVMFFEKSSVFFDISL